MKLPRPYIPYKTRVEVAARQALAADIVMPEEQGAWPYTRQLRALLFALFGDAPVHLDHDPALCNRRYYPAIFTRKIARYEPDANDPQYLIYRKVDDHKIKTLVRGDGALRSDLSQRRYLKRVAQNRIEKEKFTPRRAKQIRRIK